MPEPRDATNDVDFVKYFLQAAAGNIAGAPARLKAFLPTDTTWQPGSNAITIVRQGNVSSLPLENRTKVDMQLRAVGRLTAAGTVEPIVGQPASTVTFTVVPAPTASKRMILDAPTNVMYLDSVALTQLYTPYPIYFWDPAGTELIPDLRYLPLTIPEGDRTNEVVRWILGGPSSWLLPVVTALPPGIELRDQPVVTPDGRLVVNLTAEARAVEDPDRLAVQLRWSLRDVYPGRLTLQIERQTKAESVDESYLPYNRATLPKEQPEAFCIAGGVVRPMVRGRALCDVTVTAPTVLAPQINTGVVAAALTREHSRAAVVRAAPNGRFQLVVSQMLQNDKATVTTIGPSFATIGRPTWFPPHSGAARGLVPIEGQLYEFAVERATPSLRAVSTAGLRNITAIAVAPDGRRVALVAGGRAYVATIGDRATVLDAPRLLSTTVDSVVGIGWTRQDRVVIGGFDVAHKPAITEVTIDGAVEAGFTVSETFSISYSYLVASPANPTGGRSPGSVMVEGSGFAWIVFAIEPQQIQAGTPTSAAPGSGSTKITAPFFAE